jgi:hypothetical protein
MKKGAPDGLFEIADVAADGALRNVQVAGRLRKAQAPRRSFESPQ